MQPTFKEQLLQEEENLKNKVNDFNFQCKNLNSKEKLNILSSKKNNYNSSSNISALKSTLDNSVTSLVVNDSEEFISQNFKLEEKTVKCLLLGDKHVGKTFFRNKLLEEANTNITKPTTMLEVKKKHYISGGKLIKLEVMDTNITIQNSPLLKCKF